MDERKVIVMSGKLKGTKETPKKDTKEVKLLDGIKGIIFGKKK
jgi:hypothetical protein